jgi:hypothetical protein
MSTTGYYKNNYVYLRLPKNGSTTFRTLLINNGWEEINLFDTEIDLTKCFIWGHITNPFNRHTKGLSTFLQDDNPDIDIDHPGVGKLLVSGVFDGHTYSISMTLGHMFNLPIYWIPLDAKITDYTTTPSQILNGNDLTNHFFKEHNLGLHVTDADVRWSRAKEHQEVREKIEQLKKQHHEQYQQLVKHILEPDLLLYNKVVVEFEKKYH